ncbi:MAG: PIN domain-containing protein [Planctomycetota bacterium]
MSRLCLDSSACSYFRRGHERVVHLIDRVRDVHLPVVVVGELRAGLLLGSRREENEPELRALLSQIGAQVLSS